MTTVFSLGPYQEIHDINVESQNGCFFTIDIIKDTIDNYHSTVTISDKKQANSVCYDIFTDGLSANDNYQASIEFIQQYLANASDSIVDIHNRCNCPFVSEADQNSILQQFDIPVVVRVNDL